MAGEASIRIVESDEEEWEEWNPERGTFLQHCIAGSAAGAAEHLLMFPMDTYKTYLQYNRGRVTNPSAMATTSIAQGVINPTQLPASFSQMVRELGFLRLWRGAPAMLAACIPSHAAYFPTYEFGKEAFGANKPGHHPVAAASAGVLATLLHDAVMTPMDVVKQRLQLGYYRGVVHCLKSMIEAEGFAGLFRSYPTTVLMNVPYAAVNVATNESMKKVLANIEARISPNAATSQHLSFASILLSGATAGAAAAAITCPLDVIKTRLQTATLAGASGIADATSSSTRGSSVANSGGIKGTVFPSGLSGMPIGGVSGLLRPPLVALLYTTSRGNGATPPNANGNAARRPRRGFVAATIATLREGVGSAVEIARDLWREEGAAAFFKGARARVLVATPSMAVSWGTYEAVKRLLASERTSS